jgi:hypothetical protein
VRSLKQGKKNIGQRLLSEKTFALVMILLGTAFTALGVYRFRIWPEHFGLLSFLGCIVGVFGAFFLLLVTDYVFHHAPRVFIVWFIFLVYFAFVEPHFAVGLGLALWGMFVSQLRS